MSVPERRAMVERPGESLSVRRQCALLNLARSGVFRRGPVTGAGDLALMRRIDELHLKWPFYGSRRMVFELNQAGHGINRKRVQRLMRVMGIEALVPRALARTGSRQRGLWICRFAWTTQTRCPHTHSRRKRSSRKLLDLEGQRQARLHLNLDDPWSHVRGPLHIPNFFFQISSVRLPQRSRNSDSTLFGSLKQCEIIPPLKTAATMPIES